MTEDITKPQQCTTTKRSQVYSPSKLLNYLSEHSIHHHPTLVWSRGPREVLISISKAGPRQEGFILVSVMPRPWKSPCHQSSAIFQSSSRNNKPSNFSLGCNNKVCEKTWPTGSNCGQSGRHIQWAASHFGDHTQCKAGRVVSALLYFTQLAYFQFLSFGSIFSLS